jgi:hypothetical protein
MINYFKIIFVINQKYERGGRLEVWIQSSLYGDISWTEALRQIKFGTEKDQTYLQVSFNNFVCDKT